MSSDNQLSESEMVEEVEAILKTEQTGIGWMYRALKEGIPREKIMEAFQAQTSGFIYSYQNIFRFYYLARSHKAPLLAVNVPGSFAGS